MKKLMKIKNWKPKHDEGNAINLIYNNNHLLPRDTIICFLNFDYLFPVKMINDLETILMKKMINTIKLNDV